MAGGQLAQSYLSYAVKFMDLRPELNRKIIARPFPFRVFSIFCGEKIPSRFCALPARHRLGEGGAHFFVAKTLSIPVHQVGDYGIAINPGGGEVFLWIQDKHRHRRVLASLP
jgi:hypothetical protein